MDFMYFAVEQANIAYSKGEVPIGCVIVNNDKIISSSFNMKNLLGVSVYHAEILCIIDACKKLGTRHLDDCDIYVTLKPCAMCLSAIIESKIKNVYYLLDSDYFLSLNINFDVNFIKCNDTYKYKELFSSFFAELR